MRGLICSVIVATAFAAALDAQQATPSSSFRITVGTATYFANGDVRSQSAGDVTMSFGTTTTLYAHSGPTLCGRFALRGTADAVEARAALAELQTKLETLRQLKTAPEVTKARKLAGVIERRQALEPTKAAFGWRVDLRPIEERDGVVVVEVTWTRLWEAGRRLTNGLTATYTLSLKGGGRLPLDRLPADSNTCGAIGIGLEIAVQTTRATVVETEVWLVHRKPDGSETSEKQVLRAETGGTNSYVFPKAMFGKDVSGQVSPVDRDGTIEVKVAYGERFVVNGQPVERYGDFSASATDSKGRFSANLDSSQRGTAATLRIRPNSPDEVIAFPLTTLKVQESKSEPPGEHKFSLRLRSKKIE